MATDAWNARPAATLGLLSFGLTTGLVAARRGGRVFIVGSDWAGLLGGVGLLGFFAWVVGTQPFAVWSRTTSAGTDFLRHLRAIRTLRADGGLTFGQDAYPSAFHALSAWLTSAQGIPPTPESLWRAVALVCFLMLGLMLLGLMVTADRMARLAVARQQGLPEGDSSTSSCAAGAVAAALTAAAFVQTAWFGVFLGFGHIMNVLVGVCLVALLALALEPRGIGPQVAPLVAASAVAVTANAWQLLLPVAAFGALPWLVTSLRGRASRARDAATWLVGAVLVTHGLLIVRHVDTGNQAAIPTVSGLFVPDWWWWLAGGLALITVVLAQMAGRRLWAAAAVGMLVAGIGLTIGLIIVTGSSWELMLYYPVKTLWTVIVILIPLAAIASVWLSAGAWNWSGDLPRVGRILVRGGLLTIAVVASAGVLGRGAAGPSHLEALANASASPPNWSMAIEDAMETVVVSDEQRTGAIVFGIVPDVQMSRSSTWYAGVIDFMGMEALGDVGFPDAIAASVKEALISRDMKAVCRHLEAFPDSVRITGPLPEAGPGVLLATGCPERVVQPERWVSLDMSGWLTGTQWANRERDVSA